MDSMCTDKFDYLGIRLNRLTISELIDEIHSCVAEHRHLTVSYYWFHTANIIRKNQSVRDIFNSLDVVGPDGITLVWTSWLYGPSLRVENLFRGDILMRFVFSEAVQQGWGIYLLGGAPGVTAAAAEKLCNAFPGLRIVGTHHGYFGSVEQEQAVIEDINHSGATVVLVGMGQPAQEEWIVANKDGVRAVVLLGVGGYFDHVIRRIDCYPWWAYKWNLYWAYRLMSEPERLWRRYTLGVLTFFVHVLWAKSALLFRRSGGTQFGHRNVR